MEIGRYLALACCLVLLATPPGAAAEQVPDPELREVLRAAASEADSFEDRFHVRAARSPGQRSRRAHGNPDPRSL
jgi:hypothetical protein